MMMHSHVIPCYPMFVTGVEIPELLEYPTDEEALFEVN